MFDFETELKNLPDAPGVYIMYSCEDEVIYVGKAKVLKNRVRQYFQKNANHTPKVRAMVLKVCRFEYIITDSETEALVLECNLIKKYQPKYNILLKDDKHYPYLKITFNEDYPRIVKTRVLKDDGAKYFGPFMGVNTIKNTLEIITKIFKPPMCSKVFPRDIKKTRPCLNYHIEKCFAPCMGNVSKEEYQKVFYDISEFLSGGYKKLLGELKNEMEKASAEFEYEKAARIRDKIKAIEAVSQKQKIINSDDQNNMDLIASATFGEHAFLEVFFVRGGKVSGHENYLMDGAGDLDKSEIISDFIKQYYIEKNQIPPTILTEVLPDDEDTISKWLSHKRGKKVALSSPMRGEKKKLMNLVLKNAQRARDNFMLAKMQAQKESKGVYELREALGLLKIERIEAYDVSNIAGSDNVSSFVVFENGVAKRKKHRKFKIKWAEGGDDYSSMKETLYRRFLRAKTEEEQIKNGELKPEDAKFLPRPDLILIDGGKGHLSAAKEILESIEIDIPTFGMVKDSRHKTKGLVGDEGEVFISKLSSAFMLITRIQDEVHSYAISYHKKLREKGLKKSELDNIEGIGQARKRALLAHFKSMDKIKKASIEELLKADGMTKKSAKAVFEYFSGERE